MTPLDPRLLRYARRTAVHIGVLAGLGTVAAMLVIALVVLVALNLNSGEIRLRKRRDR